MKNLNELNQYRIPFRAYMGDESCGLFKIFIGGRSFYVIASITMGWEHVSVNAKGKNRCPTWNEMCMVKDIFWREDECVVQFHPLRSEYVNIYPYFLHLWRKYGDEFDTPPREFVG